MSACDRINTTDGASLLEAVLEDDNTSIDSNLPGTSELPYCFFSNDELRRAISSEEYADTPTINKITGYYAPQMVSDGAQFMYYQIRDLYIALMWDTDLIEGYDDLELVFEWYRGINKDYTDEYFMRMDLTQSGLQMVDGIYL